MEGIRSAAGFEGLVVLAVIYFLLNLLSKAGKKPAGPSTPGPMADGDTAAAPPEAVSLESILRQIEAVKRQKEPAPAISRSAPPARQAVRFKPKPAPPRQREVAQDDRGPMGRAPRTRLPSAEEVEERTSLEDEGRLVEERRLRNVEVFAERPERVIQNRDEEAAAVAARRIRSAEARNRPHEAVDHASFDQSIRKPEQPVAARSRLNVQGLRQALVWREILGPPKALQDE